VRNLVQAAKTSSPAKAQTTNNFADDMLSIMNGVQEDSFVQSVLLNKGSSPTIIGYLPEQLKDMCRFCSKDTVVSLRAIIGVDRTFNLGSSLMAYAFS